MHEPVYYPEELELELDELDLDELELDELELDELELDELELDELELEGLGEFELEELELAMLGLEPEAAVPESDTDGEVGLPLHPIRAVPPKTAAPPVSNFKNSLLSDFVRWFFRFGSVTLSFDLSDICAASPKAQVRSVVLRNKQV